MELVDIDSRVAMETPSELVYTQGDIKIRRCLIPQTPTVSGVLFFVDRDNGDALGSYHTLDLAIDAAKHRMLPRAEAV